MLQKIFILIIVFLIFQNTTVSAQTEAQMEIIAKATCTCLEDKAINGKFNLDQLATCVLEGSVQADYQMKTEDNAGMMKFLKAVAKRVGETCPQLPPKSVEKTKKKSKKS